MRGYTLIISLLLLLACKRGYDHSVDQSLHNIASIDFENGNPLDQGWDSKGDVTIKGEVNKYLEVVGDGEKTAEWFAEIPLQADWRRIRVSGKVRIPRLSPLPQFGKTARLYTAFYSSDGDLLSFTGDVSFNHLTWRYPFEDWRSFEFSFNLPEFIDKGQSKGENRMIIKFEIREAKGEMDIDNISIDVIPEKEKMKGDQFDRMGLSIITQDEPIGSTITEENESSIKNVFHVNKNDALASDDNAGSIQKPLLTLKRALSLALDSNIPTKIVLHEGTYMEENQIVMKGDRSKQPLLVIEGQGDVEISGASSLDNWKRVDKTIYEHEWFYDMGISEQVWAGNGPWGNAGYIDSKGLRREVVFINNDRVNQVFHKDSLKLNTFYVDEIEDKMWLMSHVDLEDTIQNIEAGVLGDLLNVSNRGNMVLRNLKFVKGAKFIPFGSVEFSSCENILIEHCQFSNNNSSGILLNYVEHITMKDCQTNSNGWNGFKFEYASYILSEKNETSYNGWRGNMGGINGWDLAANKNFNTHHYVIDGLKVYDNRGEGLWFDWCNSNVTIRNVDIVGNHSTGIYYEASQGPAAILNARIAQNGNSGIQNAEAWNLTISNSEIYDNSASQLEMRARLRTGDDRYSPYAYLFTTRNLKVNNTVFSSSLSNSYLFEVYSMRDSSIAIYDDMIETYQGIGNSFYHERYDTAFSIERHKYTNVLLHDRKTRGGRKTLEFWTQNTSESDFSKVVESTPRIRIKGLPENNTLKAGHSYKVELFEENVEVDQLLFGWISLTPGKDKFKYFLSDFNLLPIANDEALIPPLSRGKYAIVAYGFAKGKLYQSNRIDIGVD